jgi:hypothetical protein
VLLLQDLNRGLVWRIEERQQELISFGDNGCRISGETAALGLSAAG